MWHLCLSYQVTQLFPGLIIVKKSLGYWIAIADTSTKRCVWLFLPLRALQSLNPYEYVCCGSCSSLSVTERSPTEPCSWKVMNLSLTRIRLTDSRGYCRKHGLSCWVLVPTEAPPEGESLAQLCLRGLQPGRHFFPLTWAQSVWNWDTIIMRLDAKRRHQDEVSVWDVCPTESHTLEQKAEKQLL